MKINILKTTLTTTALFTTISCLVQAPAQAWGGAYRFDGSYFFDINNLDATSSTGVYGGAIRASIFPSGVSAGQIVNEPSLDLKAQVCCQAGSLNLASIKQAYIDNKPKPDNFLFGTPFTPGEFAYAPQNKSFVLNPASDIVQYSFSFVQKETTANGIFYPSDSYTFFFFVPNKFILDGKKIDLNVNDDLINSLKGLKEIDAITIADEFNSPAKFNPLVAKIKTSNLPGDTKKTPEASNIFALITLGIIGIGVMFKSKKNSQLEL